MFEEDSKLRQGSTMKTEAGMDTGRAELLAKMVEEGTRELQEALDVITVAYGHRSEAVEGQERAPKRLLILDCSGEMRLGQLTALGDARLNPTNVDIVDVTQGLAELPIPLENIAGVIITGAPTNVSEKNENPWITQVQAVVAEALEADKSVLGICFGTQLHADMTGRPVVKNAGGREVAVWQTTLHTTEEISRHPIFEGIEFQGDGAGRMGALIESVGSHMQRASFELGQPTIHGFSYPPYVFDFDHLQNEFLTEPTAYPMVEIENNFVGVQFHPEMSTLEGLNMLRAVIKKRADLIAADGHDPVELVKRLDEYRDTVLKSGQMPDNQKFLRNFVNIVLGKDQAN